MGFEDDFKNLLKEAGKNGGYRHTTALAEAAGVSQSSLSQYLSGKRASLNLNTVARILDTMGVSLARPDNPAREVCFVNADVVPAGENLGAPESEDYFAVPLVAEVGAGAGYIPQDELRSWLLVWRWQSAVRQRRNLIAVELAENAHSMEPSLYPGDIVLVDRDETRVAHNGKIWLVRDPLDGSAMIKRVAIQDLPDERDSRITFYSDNPAYPPSAYSLNRDFYGDSSRAVVGRVVWAWSDISNK